MTKEFIPYEQALALKELGFDEPCLASWTYKTKERIPTLYGCGALLFDTDGLITNQTEDIICSAPTFSQAFRWFREKYGLHTWITSKTNDKGETVFIPQGRTIPDTIKNNLTVDIIPYYTGKSSEEAELECLIKLIEIIKNK